MYTILILFVLVIVILLILFFIFRNRKDKKNKRNNYRKTSFSLPTERGALTAYLKSNYSRIKQAKITTRNSERLSGNTASWLLQLGRQICNVGLLTKSLTLQEKFAAIFIVNHIFHEYRDKKAEEMKNFLQRTLILHHGHEVKYRFENGRNQSEMIEFYYDVWSTHLPAHVVRNGKIATEEELRVAEKRQKQLTKK